MKSGGQFCCLRRALILAWQQLKASQSGSLFGSAELQFTPDQLTHDVSAHLSVYAQLWSLHCPGAACRTVLRTSSARPALTVPAWGEFRK